MPTTAVATQPAFAETVLERPVVTATGNVFTSPTATVNQAPLRQHTFEVRVGTGANDKTVQLSPGESIKDADFAPEMVLVPPGKFWMGSKEGERKRDELSEREVTIGYPLLVSKYPVTFNEWDAFDQAEGIIETKKTTSGLIFKKTEIGQEKYTPGSEGWGRGRRPVINVSWHDAKTYVTWLSKVTGKIYRLLSEAEWEYACRAGTTTAYSFGKTISKTQAQFSEGSAGATSEVGSFPANAFGLHDMHGNVWEWCEDAAWAPKVPPDGSARSSTDTLAERVVRGGAFHLPDDRVRAATRHAVLPYERLRGSGFRLARTVNPPS